MTLILQRRPLHRTRGGLTGRDHQRPSSSYCSLPGAGALRPRPLSGTRGSNPARGSAYTFARTGAAARTETAKLTASDGAAFDELGDSVAIDGDTIVAGAPTDDIGANDCLVPVPPISSGCDQGSAYTFARTGAAARSETAKDRGSAPSSTPSVWAHEAHEAPPIDFADPEGNVWEVAWVPFAAFDERGGTIWP